MRGVGAAVRKTNDPGREPLFLACPEWAHDFAYPVVQHLRALGKEPELIPGPEDVVGVVHAIGGKSDSLIVLCHVGTTGEAEDTRLRAVLERKGLLGERIVSVQLDSAPPSIIVDQIYGALQQEREPFEEVITQRVPEETLQELAEEELVGDDDETRVGPPPTSPAPQRRATQMGIAPPALGPAASQSAPVERVIENPAATSFADGQSPGGAALPTADDSLAADVVPQAPRRGVPKALLVFAGVVLLGLGTLVLLTLPGAESVVAELRGQPQAAAVQDERAAPDTAGEAAPVERVEEIEERPSSAVAAPPKGDAEAPAEDAPREAGVAPAGADDTGSAAADGLPAVADETSAGSDTAPPEDAAPADEGDDGTGSTATGPVDPLERAVADNQVRRFEGLLVTRERREQGDHAGAIAYCEGLSLAGFDDWRLPDIGLLSTIGRARLIGKRAYWSTTTGDKQGDMALIWSGKRRSIRAMGKAWQRGRAVCVRDE